MSPLVVAGDGHFAYKHVRSDVEEELNGLVTHDRRLEAPPQEIRAADERAKEL
jgi:hypothetical protein